MSLLDIKALEIDIEATQKKFNTNWKELTGKDENVDLANFHILQNELLELIKRYDLLRTKSYISWYRTELVQLEKRDGFKLACSFVKYNWKPVYIDVGQKVRELERLVKELSEKIDK